MPRWKSLGVRPIGLLVALLVGLLVGPLLCGGIGFASAAETPEPPTYLIGPGDNLIITVWRQPDLSTSVTVRPDGRISIPLVEDLVAAGKTPEALADEIAQRLTKYLQLPLVTVTVGSGLGDLSQQIRVISESNPPKAVPYRAGMTVLDAIIQTGGLSRQADGNAAKIVRRTDGKTSEIPVRLADLVRAGDASANMPLQPGDVIVIPEGFFSGEWQVTYNASATETFSDNIDQKPSGQREKGLITRAGPGMTITGNTARVKAKFNGNLIGVYQAGGDEAGFSVDPSVAGTSTTELVSNLLFFDFDASVSRQLLNSRQATSGSGASTANRNVVATVSASPYLVHRLGNFADVEWRYRFTPVLVSSSNSSDAYNHEGSLTLTSGTDFQKLQWTFANNVGQEVRTDQKDITTANTDLELNYELWRGFSLIGAGGYEYRDGDENSSDNFSDPTWRGGFRWHPNPDLNLQATYGHINDSNSLDASLHYRVGPRTSVQASYTEILETSQQQAASNLLQLSVDPNTGQIIDSRTGQPFTGSLGPFTFQNQTTRTRTLRLNANHTNDRNTFGLSGLAGRREGGTEGDEDFYTTALNWGHSLTQDLNLNSSASYDYSKFKQDDRRDQTYRLNVGLSYRLTSNAQASASYSFQTRDSTANDESFYENALTVGLVWSF